LPVVKDTGNDANGEKSGVSKQALTSNPNIARQAWHSSALVENAGQDIHWDEPATFVQTLNQFIIAVRFLSGLVQLGHYKPPT
jgi:hypothetical protein